MTFDFIVFLDWIFQIQSFDKNYNSILMILKSTRTTEMNKNVHTFLFNLVYCYQIDNMSEC